MGNLSRQTVVSGRDSVTVNPENKNPRYKKQKLEEDEDSKEGLRLVSTWIPEGCIQTCQAAGSGL